MPAKTSYTIIEMFTQPRHPGRVCEDMAAELGSFVVLLDGVTAKDGVTYRGKTGGRFAAEVVLERIATLDASIDARAGIDALSASLRIAVRGEVGEAPHRPGTQLAVYSAARRELWRVGDIHAAIDGRTLPDNAPPTDAIATSFRAAVLSAMVAQGASFDDLRRNDPTWGMLLPLLSRQEVFANTEIAGVYGYGVLNGDHVPERYLHVDAVPPGSEVVLATDGYLAAHATLSDAEAALAEVLQRDPLLIESHKSFRAAAEGCSFDDRGWVRFRTAL